MSSMIRFPSAMFSLYSSCSFKSSLFPSNFSVFRFENSKNSLSSNVVYPFWNSNFAMENRSFSVQSASKIQDGAAAKDSSFQGSESFFRSILASMEAVYLNKNPTAKAILELVHSADGDRICYDHFAFRTFGVNGHGIDSMSKLFLDFGFEQREELRFPAKKLKAFWFSPPKVSTSCRGSGVNGPLPRIFISELLVDQLSPEAQDIIKKYTDISRCGKEYAALASAFGTLAWEKPLYSEFQQLARESEYAAWTLVNGYALNHVTISTHRLTSNLRSIGNLNQFIEKNGFNLNSEGGILKVSPDGLLLQSSTVADSTSFEFSDGITEAVPCSYIEFAERLVLPQYKDLPTEKVEEFHRRDGFEVGNADKIFESTSKDQLTRRAA
ncbi:2-oxoadipate dioxygenase/decarboxylase, chloroplastic/amyloplastic [Nicotiana sylvestris]|uniref:2-oxoadipate dioxygenase/decarboxylase n=1 Tax=Nicotiana sylvestris TaxID=4096 RepID=A0A1U7Y6K5_NICSY|nr:PREDICTED: uncharacterized protein LOC104243986 [Nicotiana sylvestris]